MDFIMIREFLAAAENVTDGCGNFVITAKALNVNPSTFSKHIRQLEEELGAPLFDRTTRQVSLNSFGRAFLPYAKSLYDSYTECTLSMGQHLLPQHQEVSFGLVVPPTSGHYLRVLTSCAAKYPDYSFRIYELSDWQLKEMLRRAQLEFIVGYDTKNCPEFISYPLENDELVALVNREHPLSLLNVMSLRDLKNENIIASLQSSFVGNLVRSSCRSAGFSPQIWYADDSNGNLANVVDHGGGIGLMMSSCARYLAGVHTKIIPLEPAIRLRLCYFSLRTHKPSVFSAAFLKELENTMDSSAVELGDSYED